MFSTIILMNENAILQALQEVSPQFQYLLLDEIQTIEVIPV